MCPACHICWQMPITIGDGEGKPIVAFILSKSSSNECFLNIAQEASFLRVILNARSEQTVLLTLFLTQKTQFGFLDIWCQSGNVTCRMRLCKLVYVCVPHVLNSKFWQPETTHYLLHFAPVLACIYPIICKLDINLNNNTHTDRRTTHRVVIIVTQDLHTNTHSRMRQNSECVSW